MTDHEHGLAAVDAQVHVGERAVRPRRVARVHVADVAQDEQRLAARRRRDRGRRSGVGDRRGGTGTTRPRLERDRPIGGRALRRAVRHVHDGDVVVASRASAAARRVARGPRASTIAVDSSEISSCGRRASAAATARRCSSPPDSVDVSRSANARSPTRSSSASTSTRRGSRQAPHDVVAHAHAEHLELGALEHDRGAAGRTETGRARARRPRRSSARRPASMRASVDFPEPFGPTIATSSPASISSETSCSTSALAAGIAVADDAQRDRHRRRARARTAARALARRSVRRRVDARVGFRRERGAHPAQRRRGDALRERGRDHHGEEQRRRDREPPVAQAGR